MPFNIVPLKDQKPMHVPFNKSIPLPEEGGFRVLISAASGQGKTVLLLNLMKEYRKFFKKFVVWSPNLRQYKRHFSRVMTKHDVMYEQFKEADLRHHFDKAVARNRKRPKRVTPQLFVFDDVLSVIAKNDFFQEIMLTARKENVSLIFTIHKYTFAPPIIRMNATHTILMSSTKIELGLLAQYVGVARDDMIAAWEDSGAEEKFSFLYIVMNPAAVYFKFSDKKLLG